MRHWDLKKQGGRDRIRKIYVRLVALEAGRVLLRKVISALCEHLWLQLKLFCIAATKVLFQRKF